MCQAPHQSQLEPALARRAIQLRLLLRERLKVEQPRTGTANQVVRCFQYQWYALHQSQLEPALARLAIPLRPSSPLRLHLKPAKR